MKVKVIERSLLSLPFNTITRRDDAFYKTLVDDGRRHQLH